MNSKLNQVLLGLPAYKALASLENNAPLIQKTISTCGEIEYPEGGNKM